LFLNVLRGGGLVNLATRSDDSFVFLGVGGLVISRQRCELLATIGT
jgi:hypothetical protein